MSTLAIALSLLSALPASAQDGSGVAVLDIQGTGVDAALLPTLTEVLSVEIHALKRFKVIAGRDIQSMLGFEREKDVLGCTDAACLAEIGGALGVDRIVASHIGKVGNTFVVNIKLINIRMADTEARVYQTVKGEVDELLETIRQSVYKLFGVESKSKPAAVAEAKKEPAPAPQPTQTAEAKKSTAPTGQPEQKAAPVAEVQTSSGGSRIGVVPTVLWGVGAVALVGGAAFGIKARSKQNCANEILSGDVHAVGSQVCADEAETAAKRANILYGIGLLSGGVGLAVWLLSGDDEPVAWQPVIDGRQVGVAYTTQF